MGASAGGGRDSTDSSVHRGDDGTGIEAALIPVSLVVVGWALVGDALRALAPFLPRISAMQLETGWGQIIGLALTSVITLVILSLVVRPDVDAAVPLRRPATSSLLGVLVVSVAVFVWGGPVSGAVNEALGLSTETPTEFRSVPPIPLFVLAVTLVPIVEEALFRGALFGAVLDRWDSVALAVVLSSLVFGIVHVEYGAGGALSRVGMGALYATLRARYDSLTEPVLAHGLVNAVAFGGLLFG